MTDLSVLALLLLGFATDHFWFDGSGSFFFLDFFGSSHTVDHDAIGVGNQVSAVRQWNMRRAAIQIPSRHYRPSCAYERRTPVGTL